MKDLKNLVNKKPCFSYAICLILSELPVVDFIYRGFFIILIYYVQFFIFFGIPRQLRFSVPGDCDILVCYVILYINIYIKKTPLFI